MFTEPPPTDFDLRFRLAGIPVRVHPMFWLISALLGWGDGNVRLVLVWIVAVFGSILLHELGHALCSRRFGNDPWIVLYSFGGLAMYYPRSSETTFQRVAILFCGPLAGFLLAGVIGALVYARGWPDNFLLRVLIVDLLYINIFWGLVNLLPVWPLDGGQISYNLLRRISPARGAEAALGLSVLTAGAVALWALSSQRYFLALFFGVMAVSSMQGAGPRR